MPFESEAQREWMFANKPEMARRWAEHTPKDKKLPKRVGKMTNRAYMHAFYSTKPGSPERRMLAVARVIGKAMLAVEEDGESPLVGKKMAEGGFTTKEAAKAAKLIGLNIKKEEFSLADFTQGMNVELEHSKVTKKDARKTAQIALDHLRELPDYYQKLATIEKSMSGPMKMIGDCAKCSMIGKHCGCDHKDKRRLPMIGKADEMLESVPEEIRRLFAQLPLEMQATELGGAGSTDIRPTMREMNYEMPSRHSGTCDNCAHSQDDDGYLVCRALQSDPGVARSAHCDLWTGGSMVGKARNGSGPQTPYGEQTMPDYEHIYYQPPTPQQKRNEQKKIDLRRRASAERNNGKFGFHGEAPEPVLRHETDKYPVHILKKPRKGQTKPTVKAPEISHKPEQPSRRGLRIFRMFG